MLALPANASPFCKNPNNMNVKIGERGRFGSPVEARNAAGQALDAARPKRTWDEFRARSQLCKILPPGLSYANVANCAKLLPRPVSAPSEGELCLSPLAFNGHLADWQHTSDLSREY